MGSVWKSDLYRLAKFRLFYWVMGISVFTGLLLNLIIRMDVRLGLSVFGSQTLIKSARDIILLGANYQKLLGFLSAVLISVFIGQEYLFKTWKLKWLTQNSRTGLYLSKALLSSLAASGLFLLYEGLVFASSGESLSVLLKDYGALLISGIAIYAAFGSVICFIAMLIKNSTASTIACLCYVFFSETLLSALQTAFRFSETTTALYLSLERHTLYGMTASVIANPSSMAAALSTVVNCLIILTLLTGAGLLLFRKYEL